LGIGLLFERNLGGIGHRLANLPTHGQPHLIQSLEFRDLWDRLARLAKDFAKRFRRPERIRRSITRELAGYTEAGKEKGSIRKNYNISWNAAYFFAQSSILFASDPALSSNSTEIAYGTVGTLR